MQFVSDYNVGGEGAVLHGDTISAQLLAEIINIARHWQHPFPFNPSTGEA